MAIPVHHVIESIQEASQKAEKLVLLVGSPGSGKSKILRELATNRGWKYVDSRFLLSDEILEMPPKTRAQQAPYIMSDALASLNGEVILLDDAEVLFAPVLNLKPLELIRYISRKHILVVGWPGQYADGKLSLDYNGQRYDCPDASENLTVISIG